MVASRLGGGTGSLLMWGGNRGLLVDVGGAGNAAWCRRALAQQPAGLRALGEVVERQVVAAEALRLAPVQAGRRARQAQHQLHRQHHLRAHKHPYVGTLSALTRASCTRARR